MEEEDQLDETRAQLLGLLQARVARVRLTLVRRPPPNPDDFGNMFHPLRRRRDYSSLGRRTAILWMDEENPKEES